MRFVFIFIEIGLVDSEPDLCVCGSARKREQGESVNLANGSSAIRAFEDFQV